MFIGFAFLTYFVCYVNEVNKLQDSKKVLWIVNPFTLFLDSSFDSELKTFQKDNEKWNI